MSRDSTAAVVELFTAVQSITITAAERGEPVNRGAVESLLAEALDKSRENTLAALAGFVVECYGCGVPDPDVMGEHVVTREARS